jgi:hypothetical protein
LTHFFLLSRYEAGAGTKTCEKVGTGTGILSKVGTGTVTFHKSEPEP